jgi:hypothetical protein
VSEGFSRRTLLAVVATLFAGAAAWLLLPWRGSLPLRRDALLAPFADPLAVSEVGSRVLAAVPRWRDARLLRQDLAPELRFGEEGFAARLVERVRDDFAEGRVEIVDGWVLSETEAKLYALIELLP